MDAGSILAGSREVKNLVYSAKVIYQLGAETGGPSVSINLLNMSADMLAKTVSITPTE